MLDKVKNKVEVNASIKNVSEQLTPEQQAVVEQALKLASLIDSDGSDQKEPINGQPTKSEQSGQTGPTSTQPTTNATPAPAASGTTTSE